MSVGIAPDRFAGTGARLLPAVRVFLCFLVIAVVTALLMFVTGLNGYCGDSGPSDSACPDSLVGLGWWEVSSPSRAQRQRGFCSFTPPMRSWITGTTEARATADR